MAYVCDDCGKTFTRTYSVVRHKKEACVARFANAAAAAAAAAANLHGGKQRRVDGAASTSETWTCVVCDVTVPKNQKFAHQRTSEHKNNSCVSLSPGIQVVESAFQGRIATYRVVSDNEHDVDYSVFFDSIKHRVLDAVSNLVRVRGALKINMVVVGRYLHPVQDVHSEKTFNTCNEIVTMASDLDEVYRSFVEAMKVQSTEFQEKDSGML